MKKLLLVLLVLGLALPSTASAVKSLGAPVLVPDSSDSPDSGGGPAPKSWLFNDIFFVWSHICRLPGTPPCGPDPLVNDGASFNGVLRIWVPFTDLYTIYFFVTDTEGNVMNFFSGNFNLSAGTYNSFFATFPPLAPEAERVYKFSGLAVGNGSATITFGPNPWTFRQGGPGSGGCCP